MKKIFIILFLSFIIVAVTANLDKKTSGIYSQIETTDAYGNEQAVTIHGYDGTAMEPYISSTGDTLFFNSLNDGKTTSLYYANRIDDTNFTFRGEVPGVNGQEPHLDAVASMDTDNNFYWISLREYPDTIENVMTGVWRDNQVDTTRRVLGDFYTPKPGWVIMDAEISRDGTTLYYVTANFSTGGSIPSEAKIGIAIKDETGFNKLQRSDTILANINKSKIVYAPSISTDGLKLLFTRLLPGNKTEICIAERDAIDTPFGEPKILNVNGNVPEAGVFTKTTDRIYFHKKVDTGYKIFLLSKTQSAT